MAKKRRAAKKAVKEDYSKYLLAIVAIVAVVGVVLMVNNGGTTSVSEGELVVSDGGDLAGEARRAVSLKPNLLKAKKLYVNFLPLMNAYKPDLVPLGAFFVAESTEKCAIKVYVKNQGLASTESQQQGVRFLIETYLPGFDTISAEKVFSGYNNIFYPGDTREFSIDMEGNFCYYYYKIGLNWKIVVDPKKVIDESNENNNELSGESGYN